MKTSLLATACALVVYAACASDSTSEHAATNPKPVELQPERPIDAARRLFAEGNIREAMIELDASLDLKAEAAEVQFLRGECALRMGEEDANPFFFEDARTAFLEAASRGEAPSAWFGAARATWMLYFQSSDAMRLEEALDYLRTGMQQRHRVGSLERFLSIRPERTRAEVQFSAYTAAKSGALPESMAPELFEETRDALEAEVGLDPVASWGWNQLSNLYLWEGRRADARQTITSGIELAPEAVALHEAQAKLAQEDGGWSEVHRIYESFVKEHAGIAIGHWWLGRAEYELALERMLAAQSDESAAFALAEEHLRRARELEPEYTESCQGFEVMCRDGSGWSHYYAGDIDAAQAAFLSMEELFEGGLRWQEVFRLRSGLDSLAWVLAAHNSAWESGSQSRSQSIYEEAFAYLVKAAELANTLFAYDPESWNHANNAGYFNRDIAVQYASQGVAALENTDKAKELFNHARRHMEQSYAAYVIAAQLAPEDARTVNDTGLILAYYLQRDLETAEQYFMDAIEIGLPQLEAGIDDEEQRTMTREAVGDAHQNLGVLELTLRGNAAAARPLFEVSLNYERGPRVEVTRRYLPLCDAVEAGEIPIEQVIQAHYWKDLDIDKVKESVEARRAIQTRLGEL